jgi:hypothetical protein
MYRIRVLLAVSVALLAAGALVASSASAACVAEKWCIAGAELKTGESAELAKMVTLSKAELSVSSPEAKIVCSSLEALNALLAGPSSGKAAELNFSGCTYSGPEGCALAKSVITTNALKSGPAKALGTKEGESITGPETGTVLGAIEFVGSLCAMVGKQPVTGKVKEVAPKGQEENSEQMIIAKSSEGEVKLGGVPVKLTVEAKIKLASGSKMKFG